MKSYKVIVEFIDQHTRVYYPVGGSYETDDTKRAQELQKGGFLEETTEKEKEKQSSESETSSKSKKGKKS